MIILLKVRELRRSTGRDRPHISGHRGRGERLQYSPRSVSQHHARL